MTPSRGRRRARSRPSTCLGQTAPLRPNPVCRDPRRRVPLVPPTDHADRRAPLAHPSLTGARARRAFLPAETRGHPWPPGPPGAGGNPWRALGDPSLSALAPLVQRAGAHRVGSTTGGPRILARCPDAGWATAVRSPAPIASPRTASAWQSALGARVERAVAAVKAPRPPSSPEPRGSPRSPPAQDESTATSCPISTSRRSLASRCTLCSVPFLGMKDPRGSSSSAGVQLACPWPGGGRHDRSGAAPSWARWTSAPYLCRDAPASAASGLSLLSVAAATLDRWLSVGGGALSPPGRPGGPSAERLTGAVPALSESACARAPGLISVRGPGLAPGRRHDGCWGDPAWKGGAAARSFRAVHARVGVAAGAGREPAAAHRCDEGCARITFSRGLQRLLAELTQRVVAALQKLARDRQAGAVCAQPIGGLGVVVAVRRTVAARHLGGLK
jgi:hypothetical protein